MSLSILNIFFYSLLRSISSIYRPLSLDRVSDRTWWISLAQLHCFGHDSTLFCPECRSQYEDAERVLFIFSKFASYSLVSFGNQSPGIRLTKTSSSPQLPLSHTGGGALNNLFEYFNFLYFFCILSKNLVFASVYYEKYLDQIRFMNPEQAKSELPKNVGQVAQNKRRKRGTDTNNEG